MSPTLNEKLIAYLALFSGLAISVVAEYYSILGLTAIFSAAVLPVIIMGVALGIGKITATVWLKQNWDIAPISIRSYLGSAIVVLMLITSMGIFGFLSKAHSDQSLVSGDALAKISIYDEKIKIAKENIDANRKALKQLDEAVDQVMGRSQDEKGADKAVAIRRGQAKERTRLLQEITAEQKAIAKLNEERAPIAAEVRKVEAEVGPIKYIAAFVYGDTEKTVLEKAVTWVIIIIVLVFDPLAVILLLSSQISFQNFRERLAGESQKPDPWIADVGEKPTEEELKDDFLPTYEEITPKDEDLLNDPEVKEFFEKGKAVARALDAGEPLPEFAKEDTTIVVEHHPDTHPYLRQGFKYPADYERVGPMVAPLESTNNWAVSHEPLTKQIQEYSPPQEIVEEPKNQVNIDWDNLPPDTQYLTINGERMHVKAAKDLYGPKHLVTPPGYVQNEEQQESGQWNKVISEQEYRAKAEEKIKNESNNNTGNSA